MIKERINLWEDGEFTYPDNYGFTPFMIRMAHDEDPLKNDPRPTIIVCPGGGYACVSPSEGIIVANKFYEMGFDTFTLAYTTNTLCTAPLYDQPMKDLSRAIRIIRKRSHEFNVGKITACGFSAAGHLVASVCVHYKDVADTNPLYANISNRPDAAILGYPVISSGKYAHRGSFDNLIGTNPSNDDINYYSCENFVTSDTPPFFIWHTATDGFVPRENSIMFAEKLLANDVPFALHIFSKGNHGLSLSNEDWKERRWGGDEVFEQSLKCRDAVIAREINMSPEDKKNFLDGFKDYPEGRIPIKEVSIWPELAVAFLKEQGLMK